MTVLKEHVSKMAADEASTAGDECFHDGGIRVGVYFSFDDERKRYFL